MAYLREIIIQRCRCGSLAKVELCNARGAVCGHFCKKCGIREQKRLSLAELEEEKRRSVRNVIDS